MHTMVTHPYMTFDLTLLGIMCEYLRIICTKFKGPLDAMQMYDDLCWFVIPWSSLMWPKDYLNICAIYFIKYFLLIFFKVAYLEVGYAYKNLPNQDSWGDIHLKFNHHPVSIVIAICQICHNSIPQNTPITTFLLQEYCIMPLWESTYFLALQGQLSNIT